MARYISTKLFENYSVALRQWKASHSHCELLHGYALKFKVWFASNEPDIDKQLDSMSWIVDYGGFKTPPKGNGLKDYDVRGVDGIVSRMTDSASKGYLNRFFVDLKKLSPSDQKNSLLAVKNGLVTQMLDSPSPLDYLNKNSSAFIKVFGINEYNNLNALADVSRLSKTLDISKLNFSKAATEQESALQRAMGGVAPQRITGILVNQIASVFNKGFRILSLIGQQNIDQATKDAQRKLFLDENGVKAIVDASTKFFTKKGEEIQLKTMVTPDDVNKFATAVGLGALRQNYYGVSATASPSEVVRPQEAVVEEE